MRALPTSLCVAGLVALAACGVGSPVHIASFEQDQSCGDRLTVGDSRKLGASTEGGGIFGPAPYDSERRPARFRWSVSDPSVATIDGYGVIRALAAGSVTVRVESKGYVATRDFTVIEPLMRATVAPATLSLAVGDSAWLHTEAWPLDGDAQPGAFMERFYLYAAPWGVADVVWGADGAPGPGRDSIRVHGLAAGTTSLGWCAGTRSGVVSVTVSGA